MLVWRRVWERRSTSIVSRLTVFELFGGGHVGVEDPTRGVKRAKVGRHRPSNGGTLHESQGASSIVNRS